MSERRMLFSQAEEMLSCCLAQTFRVLIKKTGGRADGTSARI